ASAGGTPTSRAAEVRLGRGHEGPAFDDQCEIAEAEHVTVVKRRWRFHPAPVQERPVPALEILEQRLVALDGNTRVTPRDEGVVDTHRGVRVAADHVLAWQQGERQPRDDQPPQRAGGAGAARGGDDLAAEGVAESMDRADEPRLMRPILQGRANLGDHVGQAGVRYGGALPDEAED